ncbi:MAG: hypothetical protein KBT11_04785 [Treponema sp.]|nr:hypothetical protein [Candidatus Treponema equifaecale]
MKKTLLMKASIAFLMSAVLAFSSCSNLDQLDESSSAAEGSSRAAITGVSSLYSSDLTASSTFTSNFVKGNYTIYATAEKTVSVPKVTAVTVNGKSLAQEIKLGGAGYAGSYRCIGFQTSGSATITVYAKGAAGRKLALVNGSGNTVASYETGDSVKAYTFTASSAGNYFIQSLGSSISIYYIKTAVGDSTGTSSGSTSSGSTSSGSTTGSSTTTTVSGKSIVMNGTSYSTIQAALNAATGTGSYTIKLGEGTYNECLYYYGKGTVKIQGQTTSTYGANVKISAANSQTLKKLTQANTTQKARCLFEFEGSGNLILENITLENTFSRSSTSSNETQAEALGFDASGTLAVYNCSFKSHQDTIRTNSKCWFYKSYIEGDVDFIWSEYTGRVALFENCKIKAVYDSAASNHTAYIAAPRMQVSSTVSKGVVFLNCSVEAASGTTAYLARTPWSSGYYNQVAYINCSMSNIKNVWYNSQIGTSYDVTDIGWKMDSTTASKLGVSGKNYIMNDSKKSAEYGDRNKIMNRYFDTSSKSYKAESNGWDLNSFASNMGWTGSSSSSSGSTSSGSTSSGSTSSGSTTTNTSGKISINDTPVGFASISKPSSTVTVSNKTDLVNYAKKGGYIIYVNGMIDMSEGMIPSSAGGSTSALDSLVKSATSGKYSSYSSFKAAYAKACSASTNDKSSSSPQSSLGSLLWACNTAYGNKIKLNVASNTQIIGLNSSSGIKGGSINISSVSNVAIRNLTIKDAYDPFPHHEQNDGFNAQHDCMVIQGSSKNIWIDHCTMQDTMHCSEVTISNGSTEKWQTYDGLLDMKGSISNIVVSYCKFYDHDKTMLIGSSDSDGSNSTRTITLHHNYFLNCGQRLPMVRNTKLHMFNNVFDASGNYYKQQYAIGCRANSLIVAENNYFGSGIYYSFKDNYGTCYASGNSDNSQKKNNTTFSSSKPFSVSYGYSLESASNAKSNVTANAGAGKTL